MASDAKLYKLVSLIMVPQVSLSYFFIVLIASVRGMTAVELAASIFFAAVVESAYSTAYIRKEPIYSLRRGERGIRYSI